MKYIDTHSHLYLPRFQPDRAEVNTRAKESLEAVFLPNIDKESIGIMHELADSDPDFFFPMMGLHPCSVKPGFEESLEEMRSLLNTRTYYGIGETGIDLYWDKTWKDEQIRALEIQIGWAKTYGLPIILHSRNALDITIEMIESHQGPDLRGIFHCFDGNLDQAKRIADIQGFKMGIGGIVTYKKSALPSVLTEIDPKHLVLETDSPYLPPVPYRSKRNESSYTVYVGQKLSEIYSMPETAVAEITNANAREVFQTAPIKNLAEKAKGC